MYRNWPEITLFSHLSIAQDVPPRPTRRHAHIPDESTMQIDGVPGGVDGVAERLANVNLDEHRTEVGSDAEDPADLDTTRPKTGYTGQGLFPYLGNTIAGSRPKTFAQPIVFFDIRCLWRFGTSAVARHLTHLRLRIPSRDVASTLILTHKAGYPSIVLPKLTYLDLSTTNVRLDTVLSTLLHGYLHLEHLVLDRTNLFGFGAGEKGSELCKDLGSLCVSVGLARGKERERAIALWDSAERTRNAKIEQQQARQAHDTETEIGEVAGEAETAGREFTATQDVLQSAIARSRRGHRSAAQATFSLRDRPRRQAASPSTSTTSPLNVSSTDRTYLVLPPLPRLRTVSIGGEAHALPLHRIEEWDRQFHLGWTHSLERLSAWAHHVADKYERAQRKAADWHKATHSAKANQDRRKSAKTSTPTKPPLDVRLFRFPVDGEMGDQTDVENPIAGLIQIHPESRSYLDVYLEACARTEAHSSDETVAPPCVLCTVPDSEGPARRGAGGERVDETGGMTGPHRPGCGHEEGRRIWGWQHV